MYLILAKVLLSRSVSVLCSTCRVQNSEIRGINSATRVRNSEFRGFSRNVSALCSVGRFQNSEGLVQDQKTYSGMVGATLAVDRGRRTPSGPPVLCTGYGQADPYRGNPACPICVCTRRPPVSKAHYCYEMMIGALRAGDCQHLADFVVSVCPTRADWRRTK